MRTNIEIDDDLMEKAIELGHIKTKKGIVEEALRLYITIQNQKKLIDLKGKIKLDDVAFQ